MSLSDRYNRGDGRIQRMDKYLTERVTDSAISGSISPA